MRYMHVLVDPPRYSSLHKGDTVKYVVYFYGSARKMGPFYTRADAQAVASRHPGAYIKLVQFDPWA